VRRRAAHIGSGQEQTPAPAPARIGGFDATGVRTPRCSRRFRCLRGPSFGRRPGCQDLDIGRTTPTTISVRRSITAPRHYRPTATALYQPFADTLHFVWFQVEQNAFKDSSLNALVFRSNRDLARGVRGWRHDRSVRPSPRIDEHVALTTRASRAPELKADLPEGLAPARPRRSTSRGTSRSRSMAPIAWGATGRCMSSRSGIRESRVR